MPAWVKLPCSAALPFGAFEAVLDHQKNAVAAAAVKEMKLLAAPSDEQLADLRSVLRSLEAPAEVQQQISAAFQESGQRALEPCYLGLTC